MSGSDKKGNKLKDWLERFFTIAAKIILLPTFMVINVLLTVLLVWLLSKLGIVLKELSRNDPFPLIGNALLSLSKAPWTDVLLNILLMLTAAGLAIALLALMTKKLFTLVKSEPLLIPKPLAIALSIIAMAVFFGLLDNITTGAVSSFINVTLSGIRNEFISFISILPSVSSIIDFFTEKWLSLLIISITIIFIFILTIRLRNIVSWVQRNPSLTGAFATNLNEVLIKFINETGSVIKSLLNKNKAKIFILRCKNFILKTLLMSNLFLAMRDFLALALNFLSGSLHNKQTNRFLIIAATAASFASFYTTSEGLYDLLGLRSLSIFISMSAQLILLKASLSLGTIVYSNKLVKKEVMSSGDKSTWKTQIQNRRTSIKATALAVVLTMFISTSFSYVQLFYLAHKTMSGYNAYKSYIKAECSDILTDNILRLERTFNLNQQEILSDLVAKQKNVQSWNKRVEDAHNVANGASSYIKWNFDTPYNKFKYISISFDRALDIVVDIVNNRQYNNDFTLNTTVVKSSWQPDKSDDSNKALQYEYNLYDLILDNAKTPIAIVSADVPSPFAETTFDAEPHAEIYKGYEVCNMVITEMLKQYSQLEQVYLSTNDIYARSVSGNTGQNTNYPNSLPDTSKTENDDADTRNKLAENIEIARFFASNTRVTGAEKTPGANTEPAQEVRDISYNYRASVLSLLSDVEKNYQTSVEKYPQIKSSADELSSASAAIKDSYIISKLLIEETLSILYTLPIPSSAENTTPAQKSANIGNEDFSTSLKTHINSFVVLGRKVDDRFSKHVLASDELFYAVNPFSREDSTNMPRYRMWSLILLTVATLLDLLTFISGYFLAKQTLLAQKSLSKPSNNTIDGEEIEDALYELFDPGVGNKDGESLKLIKAIMSRNFTLKGDKAIMEINSIPKVSRWQLSILNDLKLIKIRDTEIELSAEFLSWIAKFKNSNPWLFVD